MFKTLYKFNLSVEKEVEKVETREENGETIQIKKKVKEEKPVNFFIKKPTRRDMEEAETELSVAMSKAIKKGVLTKAMLAKKYADTGGALSEGDAKKLLDFYTEMGTLENEIVRLGTKKQTKKNRDLLEKATRKLAQTKREIFNLETNYQNLFNYTADTMAQTKMLQWYVVNMLHYQSNALNVGEITPYFSGKEFEEKLNDYYEKDEKEDPLFIQAMSKAGLAISYWYYSSGRITEEDIDKVMKDQEEEFEKTPEVTGEEGLLPETEDDSEPDI